jgi:hypothetical protein
MPLDMMGQESRVDLRERRRKDGKADREAGRDRQLLERTLLQKEAENRMALGKQSHK